MKKLILLLAALCCLASCDKVLEEVSFRVEADGNTPCEAGREIVFRLGGNPDYITFYSGEAGHRYEYAGRTDPDGTAHYGVSVKAMDNRKNAFTYVYENPGEYDAAFVAKNVTFEGENTAVVRLRITVSEPADQ